MRETISPKQLAYCLIISALVHVSALTPVLFGWASSLPGTTHEHMAYRVLDHPAMQPYVVRLADFGLDKDAIAQVANTEPPSTYHHPGWATIQSRGHIGWGLNNTMIGYIIHVCCDCGVPVDHSPAGEVYNELIPIRQNWLELNAGIPPSLVDLYAGSYSGVMAQFHTEQIDLALRYKADPDYWQISPYAEEGMMNGMKLAQYVLADYLEYYGVVQRHTLVLTTINGNWGTVTVDPVPADANAPTYLLGTTVTLTAVPNEGKAFRHWEIYDPNYPDDANYAVFDANNPLVLVMDDDKSVAAVFKCSSGIEQILPLLVMGLFIMSASTERWRRGM